MRFSLAGLPAGSRRARREPGPSCPMATGFDSRVRRRTRNASRVGTLARLCCPILRPSKEILRRPRAGCKTSGESRRPMAVPAGSLRSAKRRTFDERRTRRFRTTRWRKPDRVASPEETDICRQIVRSVSHRFGGRGSYGTPAFVILNGAQRSEGSDLRGGETSRPVARFPRLRSGQALRCRSG